ncbi:hypothetical protein OPQ81_000533 [Rhizoctonia solani]|nr:hypothetical protein OPQ81_000533 [Rhizoctonia solani]
MRIPSSIIISEGLSEANRSKYVYISTQRRKKRWKDQQENRYMTPWSHNLVLRQPSQSSGAQLALMFDFRIHKAGRAHT